jgi:Zn-dependent metalloprotease
VGQDRLWTIPCAFALLLCFPAAPASAQGRPTLLAVTRASSTDLRAWDAQVDQLIRSRDLRVRDTQPDAAIPNRQHQRIDQYYRFVRIVGGDLTRQLGPEGTISLFGILHTDIDIDPAPALSADAALAAIVRAVDGQARGDTPELVVLPLSDGYHLAYFGQATTSVEVMNVYVDANNGALLHKYSDFTTEVGSGLGTYGDQKKVSTTAVSGAFVTDDKLRPAAITTYDMKGSFTRTQSLLFGGATPATGDIATSTNNLSWTDSTVVDAHVYAGWFYDYLFKRFGRHGLDDRDLRMPLFTHPVRQSDIATAPPDVFGLYYLNAFYCSSCGPNGRGAALFGEGAPKNFLAPNLEVKPFSASFDVVAHELTHGVVANSSRLSSSLEGGSLNEAFADVFGVSTVFFFRPAGSNPTQASYIQGRDLTIPAGEFSRSMSNPAATDNPDHYSGRGIEVHYNSTILSHAFYLAIEGGTNRTSGAAVQGVGAANREQIEKAFFRAMTVILPSSANFGMTRTATIQAARDLYGSGSAPERAITQAWDAVGVQERSVPTAVAPAQPISSAACQTNQPAWEVDPIVSAGTSTLTINQWQLDLFDTGGRVLNSFRQTGADFARFFSVCGPGSNRVLAQTDACSALCITLNGATAGALQFSYSATDASNRPVTFATPRVTLSR